MGFNAKLHCHAKSAGNEAKQAKAVAGGNTNSIQMIEGVYSRAVAASAEQRFMLLVMCMGGVVFVVGLWRCRAHHSHSASGELLQREIRPANLMPFNKDGSPRRGSLT